MTDDAYDWMKQPGHPYYCETCAKRHNKTLGYSNSPITTTPPASSPDLIIAITKLTQSIDVLKGVIDALVADNKCIVNECRLLQDHVSQLENNTTASNFDTMYAALDEHFKRQEKKNNFVIHFLPCDSMTGANVAANEVIDNPPLLTEDIDKVKTLVSETGGDPSTIVKVFQMGNSCDDGKQCSVKVICTSVWTKRGVVTGQQKLRNKYNSLKNSGFFI